MAAVSELTAVRARTRRRMPDTKIPATVKKTTTAVSQRRRARCFPLKALCICGAFSTTCVCVSCDIGTPSARKGALLLNFSFSRAMTETVHHAEHCGDEKQRRYSG